METGFFKYLWRFNAVVLAFAGLAVVLVGLFALREIYKDLTRVRSTHQVVNTAEADPTLVERFSYGFAQRLSDGTTTTLPLLVEQEFRNGSYDKGSHSNQVNRLFVSDSGETRWLFDGHDQLILSTHSLARPSERDETVPPKARLLEVVQADTNNDDRMSRSDAVTLFLTDPDYNDLRELKSGITGKIQVLRKTDRQADLIVTSKGATTVLALDFIAGTITSEIGLPTISQR